MKNWKIALIILAFILFVGAWIGTRGSHRSDKTEIVRKGVIVDSVYGVGTLTAQHSWALKPGVTSSILKLYVQEGDEVTNHQRLTDLDGIGTFYAPFSGTVTASPFKVGETVFPQTEVLTLVNLKDTYLLVSLEQQGALRVRAGLPVRISFDGMRDRAFAGRVETIYSKGAEFLAKISTPNLPRSVLPGMTADVAIILSEKQNALLVPVSSLNGATVSLYRNGKKHSVPVKIGLVDGAYAEVLEGDVQEGDAAITASGGQ